VGFFQWKVLSIVDLSLWPHWLVPLSSYKLHGYLGLWKQVSLHICRPAFITIGKARACKIDAIPVGYATSSFYHIPAKVTLLP
jgi:hypothetical protein